MTHPSQLAPSTSPRARGKTARWLLGVTFGVVLIALALLTLPFLVDFERVKPQIQAVVSEHVNASVDFSSARLSLLPKLGIRIEQPRLRNTDDTFAGVPVFGADSAFFEVALAPLLQKQFIGELHFAKPEIVFAQKEATNNFAALAKTRDESAPPPPKAPASSPDEKALEDFKNRVLISSITLRDASFQMQDMSTAEVKVPVRISDLDLSVSNLGLGRDIKLDLATRVDLVQDGLEVRGPITLSMTQNIDWKAAGLEAASFAGKLDAQDLAIRFQDAFVKPKGTVLALDFAGKATAQSLEVTKAVLGLHTLALTSTVSVKDFARLETVASAKLQSSDLSSLGLLLPQHQKLLTKGSLALDAGLQGPLKDLSHTHANAQLRADLSGTDLDLRVSAAALEPAQVDLSARSQRLDVDALLAPFLGAKPATASQAPSPPAPETAPTEDFALTPAQKSLLEKTRVKAELDLREIIVHGLTLKNFKAHLAQRALELTLDKFALDAFDGHLQSRGKVDLAAMPLAFEQALQIDKASAESVVSFLAPAHRELLKGRLSLDLAASGRGTTKASIDKTLDAKGRFQLEDGEVHGASLTAAMQENFDRFASELSIVKAGHKAFQTAEAILNDPLVKALPQKPSFDLAAYKAKYESIQKLNLTKAMPVDKQLPLVKGTIAIKEGRIELVADHAAPAGNFAFRGSVGLDTSLAGQLHFEASPLTQKALLTQSPYANLLFDERGTLNLDLALSGLAAAPKVALDLAALRATFSDNAKALVEKEVEKGAKQLVSELTKNAKSNALDQAKKKLDEEAAKAAGTPLGKELDKAKKLLQGLGK